MRLFALAALALSAQAAPIPCFTVGPVVFTNCQTTNTASPGLPIMGFNFVPDIYPDPLFTVPPGTPDDVILFVPGRYTLDNFSGIQQSVSETLSADFTVASGYAVRFI